MSHYFLSILIALSLIGCTVASQGKQAFDITIKANELGLSSCNCYRGKANATWVVSGEGEVRGCFKAGDYEMAACLDTQSFGRTGE